VTDAADQFHFAVTFSDDELRTVSRLVAARRARQDDHFFFGMLIAVILAIGLIGFGAFNLGWLAAPSVPPVLVAAYAAFTAGYFSYWFLLRRHYRKYHRSSMRHGPWNYSFSADGIVYKSETIEVRYTWRGVEAVEDLGRIVLFRCGERAIFIPARMFSDQAARSAFVATAAAHIKAAAESG
jgi:hypothetical protein